MNKSNIPIGGYAFTGNPIFLVDHDEVLGQNQSGRFIVKIGGTQVYEGKCTAPVRINIADIVDSYTERIHDIPANQTGPVYYMISFTDRNLVEGCVINSQDDISQDVKCHVIPGGISKQNFRRLHALGTDIFESRLLNRSCDFFLTTRTPGFCLYLKETELYPLYYIMEDDSLVLEVRDMMTGKIIDCSANQKGILALDLEWIRQKLFFESGVLSSAFEILDGTGKVSCKIFIERCDPAKERYRLKFRNSLGVFEILDLPGELIESRNFEDATESEYESFDPITDESIFLRDRQRVNRSFNIDIPVKRPTDVDFIFDMLASDEVYLLDLSPLPVRVIPSCEEIGLKHRLDAPESVTLLLTTSDKESLIMADITDGKEWTRRPIFTSHFDNKFN